MFSFYILRFTRGGTGWVVNLRQNSVYIVIEWPRIWSAFRIELSSLVYLNWYILFQQTKKKKIDMKKSKKFILDSSDEDNSDFSMADSVEAHDDIADIESIQSSSSRYVNMCCLSTIT